MQLRVIAIVSLKTFYINLLFKLKLRLIYKISYENIAEVSQGSFVLMIVILFAFISDIKKDEVLENVPEVNLIPT